LDRRNGREIGDHLLLLGLSLIVCCAACAPSTATPSPRAADPRVQEAIQTTGDTAAPCQQRLQAIWTLQEIGPTAVEGVPALIQALGDENARVREAAAVALGEIGPEKGVVTALIQALGDENALVRRGAAAALGEIGPEAAGAVPALIQMLRDAEDARVRSEMVGVLGRIGVEEGVAPALIQTLLEDEDAGVRGHAAFMLGHIGPEEGVVPALVQAMEDDPGMRWAVTEGLVKIGPAAAEAVPALIQALEDECSSEIENVCGIERDAIVRALRAITGQDFADNASAWREWWEEQR